VFIPRKEPKVLNVRLSSVAVAAGAVALVAVLAYTAPGQQPAAAPAAQATTGYAPANGFPGQTFVQPGGHPASGYYGQTFVQPAGQWSAKEHELEQKSLNLARQISRTESRDEKEKLRSDLADVLQQQFDAQQKRRQAEIDSIEERLKKLRELMRKRDDSKRDIIRRRQEQLLEEAEGLGWSSPGGSATWTHVPPITTAVPPAASSLPPTQPVPRR
jgi:hypothetical protein